MIIGCYDLHLYCDFSDEEYKHRGSGAYPGPARGEFTGETASEARQQARRAGWLIDIRNERALCPYCRRLERSL